MTPNISVHFGDCLEFMYGMPDNSVDATITDFPYEITQAKWDKAGQLLRWIEEINRITRNKLLITTANQPFTTDLINANRRYWKDELVWDKLRVSGPLNARRRPLRQHETVQIFYAKQPHYTVQMRYGFKPYEQKSSATKTSTLYGKQRQFVTKSAEGERYPTSILTFNKERGKHPTKKPVSLYEWFIRSYTRPGDTIFDPFGGEFTTALAAWNNNRNCISCERDPQFFDFGCMYLANNGVDYENIDNYGGWLTPPVQ